ncbi:RNA polymerase sigma-70 factor [Paenibacillus sp. NEAU-GSW1]|uniref:RNA polymerase sigma-70 factor n=1 Tax=Paenibacillus sp. NEAU-GSW1 TaxID=2682486 RepID=UPI0012E2EF52|nr:RNA polymerase sigma-70 factor [Paenibacillus sp. NEAU-GSW1]MUT66494.1 RNA polymerase sigma-70 factor [Paenibacillus sp. NEAU-GSW1]
MSEFPFTEQQYTSYKPLLFSLAYRMLGSVTDAEDIVHEAFLSLKDTDTISNLKSYLCRTTTNRCIDRLRSAQSKRELYVGPWLPEPYVSEEGAAPDPFQAFAQKESLSTAYLLLLQQLSWVERVVFLLREGLQYEYDEIAEIVGKSSVNCRQIFHRAKQSVGSLPLEGDASSSASGEQSRQMAELLGRFVQSLQTGNLNGLLDVLSQDAIVYSDGGGKVTAAVRPITGADRVVRFFEGLLKKASPGFSFRFAPVNGEPGLLTYEYGKPASVLSFRVEEDRIADIYIVLNPDKLTHIQVKEGPRAPNGG